MITIIDYGAGNLRSVQKAIEFLGHKCEITSDSKKILDAKKVVLPGVGAFSDAMNSILELNIDKTIKEVIEKKTPFLGICLGMQLMFEKSYEGGEFEGLGILKGEIKKFSDEFDLKIPQMGWNNIKIKDNSKLFKGLYNPYVYFVHSYYLDAKDKNQVSATCEYGVTFDAAVEFENIYLTQFHPEKSGDVGLTILKNFLEL